MSQLKSRFYECAEGIFFQLCFCVFICVLWAFNCVCELCFSVFLNVFGVCLNTVDEVENRVGAFLPRMRRGWRMGGSAMVVDSEEWDSGTSSLPVVTRSGGRCDREKLFPYADHFKEGGRPSIDGGGGSLERFGRICSVVNNFFEMP